jgi:hypothetical protein
LPATELIITIFPRGPFSDGSEPSSGPNAWVADEIHLHLAAEFVGGKLKHGPRDRNAGIVDQPGQRLAGQHRANLARG